MSETERNLDAAQDWLIGFVAAADSRVVDHYWHMCDGAHRTCGCPLQGEDDPR